MRRTRVSFIVLVIITRGSLAWLPPAVRLTSSRKGHRIHAADVAPDEILALKSDVETLLAPFAEASRPALGVSDEVRSQVDLLCRQLEATREPAQAQARSHHGTWRVRFSDAPPPSNGVLGPFSGEALQIVDTDRCVYENRLTIGDGTLVVSLLADWKVVNPAEWRVAFRSIQFKFFGGALALPKITFPEGTERTWCLTYVDGDTRVVRAGVDGGRSTARDVGLISQQVGEEKDAYLFYMTRDGGASSP